MAVRSSALAKLTRPKLYDALPRPRLFALLDDAAARPIVWVCAPPGAGKTTLVASYLEARDLRYVWYQADIGDADPATFVHYMRTAAIQLAGKTAASLPVYSPDPQQNLAAFARSFFRDFFSVLPRPCAVVFDNFQELRATAEGRAAFAQGLEEIPEGVTLFVVSRTDPPPEFARLVAARRIGRIDEAELLCTPGESEAMLAPRHLDHEVVERIHRQSGGWVAGLMLIREHLTRRGAALDELLGAGKDAIFHYFAGEIFGGAKPENQRYLMLTAVPPSITAADAVALTGSDEVLKLLEYLYRRHLFTDRRRGQQTTYHYHALFREFLLEEFGRRLPADAQRAARSRAAGLLAARGLFSEALALFREAGEWEAMRALIHAHALELARQGRAQTLSDWIDALPAHMRDDDPWLEYWFGRAWIFVEPRRGRKALERAFAAFRAREELRGQALALNTIVTGYYYEWADFAPLDRWLPEFERLLVGEPARALDRGSELRAQSAWLIALLMRNPEDPHIDGCAARLDQLIDDEDDVNVRMMAASALFNYFNWKTKGDTAAGLVARIEPVVSEPGVTPLMQVWWRTHLAFWHFVNGRYRESTDVTASARTIAARFGLEACLFEIDHAEAQALVNKGEHAAAQARITEMERYLSPARRMHWPYFHFLRSMLEQRLGQKAAAAQDAERAVAMARELQLPALQMPHLLSRWSQALAALGEWDAAMRAIDEAIATSSPFERYTFVHRREALLIEKDLASGDTVPAAGRVAALMADYRARGLSLFMRGRPDLGALIANFALREGIETEYVLTLIEKNDLAPPPDACPQWPFRLRINVLGGFELVRDGKVVTFTGKAQQRPLDLLKLTVALGATNVDSQQLTAALWPDADGAAAKISFDSTLYRLRKLLGIDNALALSAGKLSLSRAIAWTDVWTLDAALDAAQPSGMSARGPGAAASAAERVLAAYRGALLGDDDEPWLAKPREAIRARVVRTLTALGQQLEKGGDWPRAADVYRRGLEADNLAEAFYRGLMRALSRTGNRGEALSTFRRCRDLLSIVLGVKPSAETERLYREITEG